MNDFSKVAMLAALAIGVVAGQDKPVQPDNTKMNKGDASKTAVTADKQKMNAGDRELTQKIRKEIVADKSLSTYAHNVKVVSQDGKVTLKGPVRSDDEKKAVVAKAVEVAGGTDKVDDQLSVKPESK
jgi:hyperosmotically inducible periplasmic protein